MAPKRGTKLPPEVYLPLWLRALDEEIGLRIETDDSKNLAQALYEARKQSLNPILEELMVLNINPGLLYIAKKATELDLDAG